MKSSGSEGNLTMTRPELTRQRFMQTSTSAYKSKLLQKPVFPSANSAVGSCFCGVASETYALSRLLFPDELRPVSRADKRQAPLVHTAPRNKKLTTESPP